MVTDKLAFEYILCNQDHERRHVARLAEDDQDAVRKWAYLIAFEVSKHLAQTHWAITCMHTRRVETFSSWADAYRYMDPDCETGYGLVWTKSGDIVTHDRAHRPVAYRIESPGKWEPDTRFAVENQLRERIQ